MCVYAVLLLYLQVHTEIKEFVGHFPLFPYCFKVDFFSVKNGIHLYQVVRHSKSPRYPHASASLCVEITGMCTTPGFT